MKTPEQIADQVAGTSYTAGRTVTEHTRRIAWDAAKEAVEADRAQRPSISHAEAQELHLAVGWVLQSMNEGRQLDVSEAIASLTRAREISALIVSDTSEE